MWRFRWHVIPAPLPTRQGRQVSGTRQVLAGFGRGFTIIWAIELSFLGKLQERVSTQAICSVLPQGRGDAQDPLSALWLPILACCRALFPCHWCRKYMDSSNKIWWHLSHFVKNYRNYSFFSQWYSQLAWTVECSSWQEITAERQIHHGNFPAFRLSFLPCSKMFSMFWRFGAIPPMGFNPHKWGNV